YSQRRKRSRRVLSKEAVMRVHTALFFVVVAVEACSASDTSFESISELVLSESTSSSTASSVRNISSLRTITGANLSTSSSCNDGTGANQACCILVNGNVDHADLHGGGMYCYKPNFGTGMADNGTTIIKPNSVAQSSPGRWVRAFPYRRDVRYAED